VPFPRRRRSLLPLQSVDASYSVSRTPPPPPPPPIPADRRRRLLIVPVVVPGRRYLLQGRPLHSAGLPVCDRRLQGTGLPVPPRRRSSWRVPVHVRGSRAPRRRTPTSLTRRWTRTRRRGPTPWCACGTTGCGAGACPGGSRRRSGTWPRRGERVRSLLAWRDPRATAVFTAFCFVAAVVFYVTPIRVVALVVGLYVLRASATRGSRAGCRRLPATSSRGCRPGLTLCYSVHSAAHLYTE
jgi:hypothetical protein